MKNSTLFEELPRSKLMGSEGSLRFSKESMTLATSLRTLSRKSVEGYTWWMELGIGDVMLWSSEITWNSKATTIQRSEKFFLHVLLDAHQGANYDAAEGYTWWMELGIGDVMLWSSEITWNSKATMIQRSEMFFLHVLLDAHQGANYDDAEKPKFVFARLVVCAPRS